MFSHICAQTAKYKTTDPRGHNAEVRKGLCHCHANHLIDRNMIAKLIVAGDRGTRRLTGGEKEIKGTFRVA